jgi:ribosomal-protein-alanine N-acetyltransferase
MTDTRLETARLSLRPLPGVVASLLLQEDRGAAAAMIGASLALDWPLADLLDALPAQAAATPGAEPFGIWVMIETATGTVVGDIGFMGPPDADGAIETGYSVVPDRRRRGYTSEALAAMLAWAAQQPGVRTVSARCDPGYEASVRTLRGAGFVRVGDVDGLAGWTLRIGS